MKRLVPLVLLFLLTGFSHSKAEPAPGYQLQILEMDETGVVLELRLTGYTLESRQHEGAVYQTLELPGMRPLTEPGQPQLPGLARLLGTPPGGVAHIRVLESESETLDGVRLFPTPALSYSHSDARAIEYYARDAALYSRDTFFPDRLAEVGLTGQLREQPVVQVRLHPFRYNPVRQELQVYRRLRVQVLFAPTFGGQIKDTPVSSVVSPYTEILRRSLLNYASLPPAALLPRSAASLVSSTRDTSPALKILVEEGGLYQVTFDDLQNAGFDPSAVDPRYLRLTNIGTEAAITVSGEGDGHFDSGDWLEFYGLAATSEFTKRNVYWLSVGDSPGLRIAERDATPTGAGPTPIAFYTTVHLEENHEYWPNMPDGEGQDHWFWERFTATPYAPHASSYSFQLQNIASIEGDAQTLVKLHGWTSTATDPDHHTQILLNGTPIDEAWWDGQISFTHTITFSQTLLRDGTNTLTVNAPGVAGEVDGLYVDGFDIGYWDTFTAEDDHLYFSAPGPGTFTFEISNFSDPAIRVYDVSDPLRPSRLVNGVIGSQASTYQIRVEDTAALGAHYLALTDAQKRAPAGLLLDTPSFWRSPDNGADYVIITHADFTEAVARLADYRASQGLRVAAVQIADVYDEFSDGIFDPGAIRSFLNYAYHNWTPPAPLYVLLVGDANYDYQDFLATGNANFVPTHLFESPLIGQTSTDNWFVSVSGDDPLPDMLLGRLSVRTLSQANIIIDKVLAYEQDASQADWHQQALFVADDEAGFETRSDELIATLPSNYYPDRIYASAVPQPYDATSDVIDAVDRGALIVNYTGHGSVGSWGLWSGNVIFDTWDIQSLNNAPRYPFLVTGNCKNGLFAYPTGEDAFAEGFLNFEGGGGIGAWSPTGLGYTYWHDRMAKALFKALFDDSIYEIGPATTSAKIEVFAELGRVEPVEMFTLFGDPALALHVVQPGLNLSKTATPSAVRPGQLLTYTLAYTNDGNYRAENVVLTEKYDPRTVLASANPAPTTGDNVWHIGSLPAGASSRITVIVRVSPAVAGGATLLNEATLSGTELKTQVATAATSVEHHRVFIPLILRD